LWEAWSTAEPLPESQQQEWAATGSARGLSLGQLSLLVAIVLPQGSAPRRATVGRWVAPASRQAGGRLAVLGEGRQRGVVEVCLDEICCHRVPILMAGEPHRRPWVAGQRGPDRSGESWGQVVANGPCVTQGSTDAGKGLERGVTRARAARHTAAEGHKDGAV